MNFLEPRESGPTGWRFAPAPRYSQSITGRRLCGHAVDRRGGYRRRGRGAPAAGRLERLALPDVGEVLMLLEPVLDDLRRQAAFALERAPAGSLRLGRAPTRSPAGAALTRRVPEEKDYGWSCSWVGGGGRVGTVIPGVRSVGCCRSAF